MSGQSISWPVLRELMTHGLTPPVHGLVRSAPPDPSLLRDHGLEPESDFEQGTLQVWLWGLRKRVDGVHRTTYVASMEYSWRWQDDSGMRRAPRYQVPYSGPATGLIERRSGSDWIGTDFTTPTGSVKSTEYLGRSAWAVELAPPARKPAPIQLVVDASTGLILQQRNDALGSVDEWTDFTVATAFDDGVFTWPGSSSDGADR